MTKSVELRIRLSPEEKTAIQEAATRASLDMSSWARMMLVQQVAKEIYSAAKETTEPRK